MTKTQLKKLINEVLSETQFLNEGLPTGKSKNAQSAAKTLNVICDFIKRPDLQNKALTAAADIINLIDDDDKIVKEGWFTKDVAAPDNLKYEKDGSGIRITNCDPKPTGKLVIPTRINNLLVTSIGDHAFSDCTGLTSVTIPTSVTSIEGGAFRGCTGLKSVTIGNSVKSIDPFAFSRCTGLTSVTLPSSLTSIGRSAFEGCRALKSVTLPSSLTSIGEGAFYACGLTSVTLPSSITEIGYRAFPTDCEIIRK